MKTLKIEQEHSIVQRLEELMILAGPEFVHELIESFFEVGRRSFEEMKLAIQSSSFDLFMTAAHNLKATSLNLGAFDLGKMCQVAENDKTFASKAGAQEILLRIDFHLTMTENFLRGFIKENHSSAS